MKLTSLHKLPIAAACLAAACAIAAAAPDDWDRAADKRKADMLYLQGQNDYNQENYDAYVALTMRAFELDSFDLDIASEWGMITLTDPNADSLTQERAYDRIKERYFSNPDDYLAGSYFADIASRQGKFADALAVWQTLDSLYPARTQPAQMLAHNYLIQGVFGDSAAFDKAIAIYERLESGSGKTIDISSQKIRAYLLVSDTAAVINEIETLAQQAPKDSRTAYFVGLSYDYVGDKDNALKYLDRACELDSANGEAYMAKAQLYSQMGDSAAYDREVFKALQSQSLDVEPKLEILREYVSQLYTDSTQETRIRSLFDELEQMHAGEPDIHNLYASYLYAIEDFPGAAEQMSYSVALNPADEGSWSSLMQALSFANDQEQLIAYAAQAQERFPDNLYFAIVRASGYSVKEHPDSAIAVLESVDIKNVKNPVGVSNFLSYKGDMYAHTGDTIKALEIYDQAIELNPENYMALNNAAYFMAVRNDDLDKAEQYAARVIRDVPDNPTYLDTYAWVFFKKKDYNMARNYIDMTLNLYAAPEADAEADSSDKADGEAEKEPSADVYEHAGDIYFMCGEPAKAVEFWEKAYKLDPDNELLGRKVKHKTYFYQ